MNDEAAEPESGITLHEDTIATQKQQISTNHNSSIVVTDVNGLNGQNRKCGRKGRRKSGTKKHRAGKNRKRRYKPYHKLSVAERQILDQRIERRNDRKRKFWHSCGISMAPLNTNQFLLDDRLAPGILRNFDDGQNFDSNSDQSSLSENDGTDSDSDEFQNMWMREKLQSLQAKSKQQLVEYFMRLEDEIQEAEREKERRERDRNAEQLTKIRIFIDEMRNLEADNEVLSKLNAELAEVVEDMHFKGKKDQS